MSNLFNYIYKVSKYEDECNLLCGDNYGMIVFISDDGLWEENTWVNVTVRCGSESMLNGICCSLTINRDFKRCVAEFVDLIDKESNGGDDINYEKLMRYKLTIHSINYNEREYFFNVGNSNIDNSVYFIYRQTNNKIINIYPYHRSFTIKLLRKHTIISCEINKCIVEKNGNILYDGCV